MSFLGSFNALIHPYEWKDNIECILSLIPTGVEDLILMCVANFQYEKKKIETNDLDADKKYKAMVNDFYSKLVDIFGGVDKLIVAHHNIKNNGHDVVYASWCLPSS